MGPEPLFVSDVPSPGIGCVVSPSLVTTTLNKRGMTC